jgi:hypothetical protein
MPWERQMRPMLDSEMPASRAIVLRDQCVALAGLRVSPSHQHIQNQQLK